MIWILIILASGSNKAAVDHVEFTSHAYCEAAKTEVVKHLDETFMTRSSVFCVAKGAQ